LVAEAGSGRLRRLGPAAGLRPSCALLALLSLSTLRPAGRPEISLQKRDDLRHLRGTLCFSFDHQVVTDLTDLDLCRRKNLAELSPQQIEIVDDAKFK
jgi:hypothetical protein